MTQYRVLARSFIGGSLVEPGAIIDLPANQRAGSNLEPLDAPRDDSKPRPIPQRSKFVGPLDKSVLPEDPAGENPKDHA
jgi:hypothetical protein